MMAGMDWIIAKCFALAAINPRQKTKLRLSQNPGALSKSRPMPRQNDKDFEAGANSTEHLCGDDLPDAFFEPLGTRRKSSDGNMYMVVIDLDAHPEDCKRWMKI